MNEYMLTWGLPVAALTQRELSEELEIAQKDGANFRTSIYAGTLVRALADCKRCEGACRLWFRDDTESPMDVCPLSAGGPPGFLLGLPGRVSCNIACGGRALCRAFAHKLGTFFWSPDFTLIAGGGRVQRRLSR